MGFLYYNTYYGYGVGTKVRGQIGKKYIYQLIHNKQYRYPYYKPANPRTAPQQNNRTKILNAVNAWKILTPLQKQSYRDMEPFSPPMSGYNYFIQQYLLAKI